MERLYLDDTNGLYVDTRVMKCLSDHVLGYTLSFKPCCDMSSLSSLIKKSFVVGCNAVIQLSYESYAVIDRRRNVCIYSTHPIRLANNCKRLFSKCGLYSIDFSNIELDNVTDMTEMFYDMHGMGTIDFSNKDLSNVTSIKSMFQWSSVDKISFENVRFKSLESAELAFDQTGAKYLSFKNTTFDSRVDFSAMFFGINVEQFTIDGLKANSVVGAKEMFNSAYFNDSTSIVLDLNGLHIVDDCEEDPTKSMFENTSVASILLNSDIIKRFGNDTLKHIDRRTYYKLKIDGVPADYFAVCPFCNERLDTSHYCNEDENYDKSIECEECGASYTISDHESSGFIKRNNMRLPVKLIINTFEKPAIAEKITKEFFGRKSELEKLFK